MTNKKAPSIRFKGFTDDWEQRKLGDETIEMLAGGDIDKSRVVENGKYPIYANALTNDGIVGYYDDYYRVKAPAITVTGRGDVGHAQARTVDFTPVVRLLAIRSEHDAYFLENAINNHGVIVESTGVPQLTVPQLGNYMIQFPRTIEEETKIGDYFRNLDNLITLHQRECERLQIVKKSMLENMFPKNGERVPKIRFSGFTDDWEQRKLSECAGFRRGSFPQPYGNKEWYDGEGAMPFVQVADVADDMKLVDDTKQKISKLAQPMSVYADKGSVLVTLQGSIGRVAITQYGAFVDRTVLIFDKYNQDIDKTFWAYIIKEKFIDEARKAPGGTIKTITKEALSDFDLMLPNYDEQKKLGAFLVSIDNLITLHQSKLEKLRLIKKSMLEQMFV